VVFTASRRKRSFFFFLSLLSLLVMQVVPIRSIYVAVIGLAAVMLSGCGGLKSEAEKPLTDASVAATIPTSEESSERAIRFLEERVKRDPDDFIAYNKLFGYYFERLRETGNLDYLELSLKAARSSLAAIPAEQNTGGLSALAQAEFAAHDFAAARDHAIQLEELDPQKSYPYQIQGDALLELGDYEKAEAAFQRMEKLGRGSVATETRLARLALLHGRVDEAQRHLNAALALALNVGNPPRETIAWSRWQLGETAFGIGNYEAAEHYYRDALITFPDYYRALASLGRVLAARDDISGAIEQYERAVRRLPDPGFVAALGDLYKLAGREKEAAAQFALVETIGHLNKINGALYNRQLALFYADHDLKAAEAYQNAKAEYQVRRDIYGADALAWTALKNGKLDEAQAAIKDALRLGTRDARLLYHAGMIARAAGDQAAAKKNLEMALTLSPRFDPLQSMIARKALEKL
jgi:tetratricopeptide (TPR) repeat protein